jgi:hypothetical protein
LSIQKFSKYLTNEYFIILAATYGKRIFEPPCVWLKYNCRSKTGSLGIEWRNSFSCNLALMYITNLKSSDDQQYIWHRQEHAILKMKKWLQHDEKELQAFINNTSKRKYLYLRSPL